MCVCVCVCVEFVSLPSLCSTGNYNDKACDVMVALISHKFTVLVQEAAMTKHVMPNLSQPLITSLVGKQQCNIGSLEAKLQASVAVDWRQDALIVWALPKDIEAAKEQLNDMCQGHK